MGEWAVQPQSAASVAQRAMCSICTHTVPKASPRFEAPAAKEDGDRAALLASAKKDIEALRTSLIDEARGKWWGGDIAGEQSSCTESSFASPLQDTALTLGPKKP